MSIGGDKVRESAGGFTKISSNHMQIVHIEALLMDNGEILIEGRTIGFLSWLEKYIRFRGPIV